MVYFFIFFVWRVDQKKMAKMPINHHGTLL